MNSCNLSNSCFGIGYNSIHMRFRTCLKYIFFNIYACIYVLKIYKTSSLMSLKLILMEYT